ncbi:hypothetical protein QBC39DRAFT_361143 [Podospora conica]|nr:hypothetical protein QBC39DRAFT_361143 [Schizothecium conicum]
MVAKHGPLSSRTTRTRGGWLFGRAWWCGVCVDAPQPLVFGSLLLGRGDGMVGTRRFWMGRMGHLLFIFSLCQSIFFFANLFCCCRDCVTLLSFRLELGQLCIASPFQVQSHPPRPPQ